MPMVIPEHNDEKEKDLVIPLLFIIECDNLR